MPPSSPSSSSSESGEDVFIVDRIVDQRRRRGKVRSRASFLSVAMISVPSHLRPPQPTAFGIAHAAVFPHRRPDGVPRSLGGVRPREQHLGAACSSAQQRCPDAMARRVRTIRPRLKWTQHRHLSPACDRILVASHPSNPRCVPFSHPPVSAKAKSAKRTASSSLPPPPAHAAKSAAVATSSRISPRSHPSTRSWQLGPGDAPESPLQVKAGAEMSTELRNLSFINPGKTPCLTSSRSLHRHAAEPGRA